MKLSTIYRKAAEIQESWAMYAYPCWAIASVTEEDDRSWREEGTPAAEFTKLMASGGPKTRSNRYLVARDKAEADGVDIQDFDVVALCFAAAIMKAEGK